jgi:hypothetical protein
MEWMLSVVGKLDDVFLQIGNNLETKNLDSLNSSESSQGKNLKKKDLDSLISSGSSKVQSIRTYVQECLKLIPESFKSLHKFVQEEITNQMYSETTLALLFNTYLPWVSANNSQQMMLSSEYREDVHHQQHGTLTKKHILDCQLKRITSQLEPGTKEVVAVYVEVEIFPKDFAWAKWSYCMEEPTTQGVPLGSVLKFSVDFNHRSTQQQMDIEMLVSMSELSKSMQRCKAHQREKSCVSRILGHVAKSANCETWQILIQALQKQTVVFARLSSFVLLQTDFQKSMAGRILRLPPFMAHIIHGSHPCW